ncbi:hypothetical protein [Pseudomonas veronii]|uniref:Uncharacterized protein n=1 Tax=Pseudomonas veronii TaxID=76761 RepID=A0A4P7Y6F1_PSEVE|nr:hypothetical protein [Pseudomonas veronii]QCG66050.1 hypothetical protein E4167_13675 [Pseudomonas veronii]
MNYEVLEVIRLLSGYFIPIMLFFAWIMYMHISNYISRKKTKEGGIMKYEMIIIGLASAILAQASFAEYSVKIPLEVNMGGICLTGL